MRLTSTFNNSSQLRSDSPLTNDQLLKIAPSIFAPAAHASRSERYAYIPTSTVLENLKGEGFQPFFVAQSKTRVAGKAEFTKHLLRLRHASQDNGKGEAHELILINSHDGSSSYQLLSGIFRFVCMNGMVCGDMFDAMKVMHSGKVVDQVIDASYQVLDQSKQIAESVDSMKALQLTAPEQVLFAEAALAVRYDDPARAAPITANQLLASHRSADAGNDLWRVFNRVQEGAVKGGLRATTVNGRRARTMPVNGLDQNTALNRALWTLAEKMRELKGAA